MANNPRSFAKSKGSVDTLGTEERRSVNSDAKVTSIKNEKNAVSASSSNMNSVTKKVPGKRSYIENHRKFENAKRLKNEKYSARAQYKSELKERQEVLDAGLCEKELIMKSKLSQARHDNEEMNLIIEE